MHELEQFADGSTGFAAGNNQDAWHQLGIVLPGEMTAQEVMTYAKLGGWQITKEPVSTVIMDENGVSTVPVPGKYVTVRTNPVTGQREIVGLPDDADTVGETYHPFQNERLTDYLQTLTDESGAMFDTAGTMRGGADVFVTMKLPKSMLVGGVDMVEVNIAVLNNHTGNRAITGLITPTRIVCANTQAAALGDAKASFKIRHTENAGDRVQLARENLGLTWKYVAAFETEAEKMINEQLSIDNFMRVCAEIWKPAKDANEGRSKTLASNRESDLRKLFLFGENNENIRGTQWAGYQAITEYLDHVAPVNGKTAQAKAMNRAVRSVDGNVVELKQKAFALLKV